MNTAWNKIRKEEKNNHVHQFDSRNRWSDANWLTAVFRRGDEVFNGSSK